MVAQAAPPAGTAGQGTHEAASATHGAAAAHGAAEEGHGKKSHFPPFDATTFASQLLWLVLSFGLLYLLMSRVALPRIGRILEERHDRIADDLEEAAKHKAESEAAQASYEKALAEARAKANAIAGETRNRLAADSEANRKSLEAGLAAKLATAEQSIASTKTEALTHVRGIAVDATHAIVSTLIGSSPAQSDVEKAVDVALVKKDAA
ncbi:F0F1 ATP synthase subunit B [Xanthobacter sp. DSM 14520]|uniref:F0F1 ATP synthase subunit B n=1 Tax=Xanthobacter autotrophicus (strain ATCC BAA-1158 / Py2) TaxID=78245 RepID=UPI00372AA02E